MLDAVIVMGKEPLCVGIPESRPLELSVTPLGKVELVLKVGAGNPDATTWKLLVYPLSKLALVVLVITGTWPTCREIVLLSGVPTPLETLKISE